MHIHDIIQYINKKGECYMNMNVTENNLKTVQEQLDNACGDVDNALMNIAAMKNLPDDIKKMAERVGVDFETLVALKNKIEMLIEEKQVK